MAASAGKEEGRYGGQRMVRTRLLDGIVVAARSFQAGLDQGGRPPPVGLELPAAARIPFRDFAHLLTDYGRRLDDEGLGLTASRLVPGTFNLVADSVIGECDMFRVLKKCVRFNNAFGNTPTLGLVVDERRIMLAWTGLDAARWHHVFACVQLMFLQRFVAWITGQPHLPGTLHVNGAMAPFIGDWRDALWGVVQPGEWFGFSVEAAMGALPNIRDHRALVELEARPAAHMLHGEGAPAMTERVRRVLSRHAGEIATLEDVSRRLQLGPRTLMRRLAAEGSSFTDLRTDVICEIAERLLSRNMLPIAEIARQLGFAETASFNRLFRRGRGMPPSRFRRQSVMAGYGRD